MNRIVIAQCTDAKKDHECEARELYAESDYFRKQREYAEAVADFWGVQSAKHGLVPARAVIEPYEKNVDDLTDTDIWAKWIADKIEFSLRCNDLDAEDAVIELLGGKKYTDPLVPELEHRGFEVHEPLRGMFIGERKSKLMDMAEEASDGEQTTL